MNRKDFRPSNKPYVMSEKDRAIIKGSRKEAKEHPTLSKKESEQVAKDHLKENPNYYDGVVTEKDIKKVNRDLDSGKITRDEYTKDGGYPITKEQTDKGYDFLQRNRRQLAYREKFVLDNFEQFRFRGYYKDDRSNRRYPLYEVLSKPDNEGHRDSFEYYYAGGKIHIVG